MISLPISNITKLGGEWEVRPRKYILDCRLVGGKTLELLLLICGSIVRHSSKDLRILLNSACSSIRLTKTLIGRLSISIIIYGKNRSSYHDASLTLRASACSYRGYGVSIGLSVIKIGNSLRHLSGNNFDLLGLYLVGSGQRNISA